MLKCTIPLFLLFSLSIISCQKDNIEPVDPIDPVENELANLVELLKAEFTPLSKNPLEWQDEQLRFLDDYQDKDIIGLGEATHGTKNFFDAKFRIFKYLVENHDFKNFIFEADFSESLYLDQAIQESRTDEIEGLMKSKMHFWIWKTTEVQRLLEWMSEYNIGKAENEKVHYRGNDCQYYTYQNELLDNYFNSVNAPFQEYAQNILTTAKNNYDLTFLNFTPEDFSIHIHAIQELQDSMKIHKASFLLSQPGKEFALSFRLLENIKQTSQYQYNKSIRQDLHIRDLYMAENTLWLKGVLDNRKTVVWAHNGHLEKKLNRQGYFIEQSISKKYTNIGFSFTRGEFYAREYEGENYTNFRLQSLYSNPKPNSLNHLFSETKKEVFFVRTNDLTNHTKWNNKFATNPDFLWIGSIYFGDPDNNNYTTLEKESFDAFIHFEESIKSDTIK